MVSVGEINAEYFSYVFPVFRYHNRWKELSKTDYIYFYQDKTNHTKGYLETQSVVETAIDLSGYDSVGEAWIDERNIKYPLTNVEKHDILSLPKNTISQIKG